MKGYKDCILAIDLSAGSVVKKKLNKSYIDKFLGGEGYGTALLWYNVPYNTHPFSPRSIISFNAGPLTGVPVPSSPKTSIVFISPLTNTIKTSVLGGDFGVHLKFAGYDSIIFEGVSKDPVYIYINDTNVEIRDARHLWGKGTYEAVDIIKSEIGSGYDILCIGEAGENLSRLANIYYEDEPTGRFGAGAVMGCKRIKALVVRGTKNISIADNIRLKELYSDMYGSRHYNFRERHLMETEYETKSIPYRQCGMNSLKDSIEAEYYTKYYGIDPISTAVTIYSAIKWYQEGIINSNELDGLELIPGDSNAIVELIKKMGAREGSGEIFADGLYYAALKIGKGLMNNIEHIKDIECSTVNPLENSIEETITNMLGAYCISPANENIKFDYLASLYSAATGIVIDSHELIMMGERILTLKRAINCKRSLGVKSGSKLMGISHLEEKYTELGMNDVLEEL